MAMSYEFEVDLQDPILKNDIKLKPENVAFLEANAEKCFLCKWMVEDYKKNGTFTGVKQSGDLGVHEIFPIRGEINHLWLELYQKPYPFKAKLSKEEKEPQSFTPKPVATYDPSYLTETAAHPVAKPGGASAAPPAPAPAAPPAEIVKNIEATPVAKPKRS